MKKQILIVDDDVILSNSIGNYLRSRSFLVYIVNNVTSALQAIRKIVPDLIISDIMMPYMNGYDFIKILRLNKAWSTIPVIFLTAKGMTEDRIKGYDLGCNAYLIKPFSPQELLSIINNVFKNIDLLQITHKVNKYSKHIDLMTRYKLTNREKTILRLVIRGYKNKEIASHLNVSIRNVEKYVSRLLSKTFTNNRTQLTKLFLQVDIEVDLQKGE